MTTKRNATLVAFGFTVWLSGATPENNMPNTGMADPVALVNAFDRFLTGLPAVRRQVMTMSLVALRGITSESINAGGNVTIDLSTGQVISHVRGLPPDGAFDLWLIENRSAPANTTLSDPADNRKEIGSYQLQNGIPTVNVTLGAAAFGLPSRPRVRSALKSGDSGCVRAYRLRDSIRAPHATPGPLRRRRGCRPRLRSPEQGDTNGKFREAHR